MVTNLETFYHYVYKMRNEFVSLSKKEQDNILKGLKKTWN